MLLCTLVRLHLFLDGSQRAARCAYIIFLVERRYLLVVRALLLRGALYGYVLRARLVFVQLSALALEFSEIAVALQLVPQLGRIFREKLLKLAFAAAQLLILAFIIISLLALLYQDGIVRAVG